MMIIQVCRSSIEPIMNFQYQKYFLISLQQDMSHHVLEGTGLVIKKNCPSMYMSPYF
jgi:hypothetical protein